MTAGPSVRKSSRSGSSASRSTWASVASVCRIVTGASVEMAASCSCSGARLTGTPPHWEDEHEKLAQRQAVDLDGRERLGQLLLGQRQIGHGGLLRPEADYLGRAGRRLTCVVRPVRLVRLVPSRPNRMPGCPRGFHLHQRIHSPPAAGLRALAGRNSGSPNRSLRDQCRVDRTRWADLAACCVAVWERMKNHRVWQRPSLSEARHLLLRLSRLAGLWWLTVRGRREAERLHAFRVPRHARHRRALYHPIQEKRDRRSTANRFRAPQPVTLHFQPQCLLDCPMHRTDWQWPLGKPSASDSAGVSPCVRIHPTTNRPKAARVTRLPTTALLPSRPPAGSAFSSIASDAGSDASFSAGSSGAVTCTMLPHRGQAMIWPMADRSRTESRAWQVTQVMRKSSTACSRKSAYVAAAPDPPGSPPPAARPLLFRCLRLIIADRRGR